MCNDVHIFPIYLKDVYPPPTSVPLRYLGGFGRSPHPAGHVGAIDAAKKFERWTSDELYKEVQEVDPLSIDR